MPRRFLFHERSFILISSDFLYAYIVLLQERDVMAVSFSDLRILVECTKCKAISVVALLNTSGIVLKL